MKQILPLIAACVLALPAAQAATVTQTTARWANVLDAEAVTMGGEMVKTGDALYYYSSAATTIGDGGSGFPKDFTDTSATIYFNSQPIAKGAPYEGSGYNNNLSIVKTDLDGHFQWTVYSTCGEIYSNNGGIAAAPDGGVYVAMKLRHTDNLRTRNITLVDATGHVTTIDWRLASQQTPRYYRGLVMKVSEQGAIEWTRMIDVSTAGQPAAEAKDYTSDALYITGLLSDSEGNIYLTGRYCNPLTLYRADGSSVTLTPHNTVGWNGDSQETVGDLFVAKFDAQGYLLRTLTTTGQATREAMSTLAWAGNDLILNAVITGANGGSIAVNGQAVRFVNDQAGLYVARLDRDFNLKWQQYFPATGVGDGSSVFQNNHVNVVGDNLWLSGMGNYVLRNPQGTDSIATIRKNVREGYLVRCSAATGQWQQAVTSSVFTDIAGIVGFTGAFEDQTDGVYAVGYNMSQRGVIKFAFDKNTLAPRGWESLITGGSQPTMQTMLAQGDDLYTVSRGRVYSTMASTQFGFTGNSALTVTPRSKEFKAVFAAFKLPFEVKDNAAKGDLNGDGAINSSDVTELVNAILSGATGSAYDISGDGQINTSDVTDLVSLILKQ